MFEPVVAAVETVAAGVEIIRPGLLAVAARGVAAYHGGEEIAAERMTDAVAEASGVDVLVGAADGLFAAFLASRDGRIVAPGGTAEFLAGFPVTALGRPELTQTLHRLGVVTLGEFAALPASAVADRFGGDAVRARRLAAGEDDRPPVPRASPIDLSVAVDCDPPLERVDVAAFTARALAVQLHRLLDVHGLACDRLVIEATTGVGDVVERTWRHDGALSAAEVTDRVRWQLDGWLTGGGAPDGIARLRLVPDGLLRGVDAQPGLWGALGSAESRADRAFAHVQGLLGPDAVVTAVEDGGRGLAERRRLVPWGEPPLPRRGPERPWPGAPPDPEPEIVVDPPAPIGLLDGRSEPVGVNGRYVVSADPAVLVDERGRAKEVVAWAGPWPVEERWWDDSARRFVRLQVELIDGTALLLVLDGGQWHVEGRYD